MTTSHSATSLARLTSIELRKAISTRASLGVICAAGLLMSALAVAVNLTGGAETHVFTETLRTTVFNASVIIPIISLMLFTSEWSSRSTLTTFALTPARWRIVLAKCLASASIGLAGFIVAVAASAASVAIAGAEGIDRWDASAALLTQTALWCLLTSLAGAALGAAILNTPGAIVAFFTLPIGIELLGMWEPMRDPMSWINQGSSMARLAEGVLDAGGWVHVAVGVAVWAALPLALGQHRIRRQDLA